MKRSWEQIVECILKTCKEPANLTKIVYQCNLNFRTAHPPIDGLMASGCLIELPGKRYKTTEKGNQVLEHFRALRELLKPL